MPSIPIRATDERVMPFAAEQIWSVLADAKSFPVWYPPAVKVTLLQATTDLVGTKFEIQPRGGRAFECHVESLTPPGRMEMRYPGNFIVGTGEWRLESPSAGNTRVTYEINVAANGWLAAILGRVLPLAKLHSQAMQDILAALERETARRNSQASRG